MSLKPYLYTGFTERTYPDILTEHGSLVVEPGDVREFEAPPPDGMWVPADKPKPEPGKKAG